MSQTENENERKKRYFDNFRITRQLWAYTQLSANAKLLLGYLMMQKVRVSFTNCEWLSEKLLGVSKMSISNWMKELQEKDFIIYHKKEGRNYKYTILTDYAFNMFGYEKNNINENWKLIEKDPDFERIKYDATRPTYKTMSKYRKYYGSEEEEVDVLAIRE